MPNTNGGKTYNNYIENLTTNSNTFQWDMRLDWNLRPQDQAFVRASYANSRGYVPGPFGSILNGSTNYASGAIGGLIENLAASETHIFSPTFFNELRFGLNYGKFSYLQPGYNNNLAGAAWAGWHSIWSGIF